MASPKVERVGGKREDLLVVVFPDTDWQMWDGRPVLYLSAKQARRLRKRLKKVIKG